MVKTTEQYALKTAVDLAKTNIESTEEWISAGMVKEFIEKVYSFLIGENDK